MTVTEQRAARDFAFAMRDLVDTHYPRADAALYDAKALGGSSWWIFGEAL